MDLAILVILVIIVLVFFKRFSNVVYLLAMVDILLRILTFIRLNINVPAISSFIAQYFPTSIAGMIDTYSTGILQTILMWVYVIFYIVFLYYVFRTFLKKRK